MRRCRLFLAVLLLLHPGLVWAAPKDELAKTKEQIKASEARQAKLAKEQKTVEEELEKLQEKLVKAASALQKNEAELAEAERKQQKLEADIKQKEEELALKRKKLDGLSRVAVRLSRTPPQAMVLMPSDGRNRIQAAHALSIITGEIKTQAEALKKDMETLVALKEKTGKEKERLLAMRKASQKEKNSFDASLKERKKLKDKLASASREEASKTAALAKKAKSLQELLKSLDEAAKPKPGQREVVSDGGVAGSRGNLRNFEAAKGRIRLPVSGKLVSRFGARESGSESSKGVKIATREDATVVATFDGEIAYSGTFLNYGKMIILKHRGSGGDNYHTLLAGLDRIDVRTGDFLLEGEPIGAMGSGNNPQLYVELRENNQPINPEKWLRGL